ncbi:hypothetical protein [Rhodoferax sp.]|uniref:hypothetical protein n=1 Tax=Rhodoferax sp. TaxID=50421 RepID=UPI0025DFAE27|nr:hypothetical protein [Rhodoferax sp.]
MEQTHRPVRPGTALALRAQALPPPASNRSRYVWLGMALLLAAIAGIGFKVPVIGVLLAAACSYALLRTASKAQKQV